jgi:hypothetical protein
MRISVRWHILRAVNDPLTPRHDVEDLARRGDEIYDRDILPKLRPEDKGKVVAIDTESGDYELAADELTAAHGLRARRPDAQIWFRRVGFRYLHRFGSRRGIAPVLTGTVNSHYEAVVRLLIRGPSGRDLEAEAIIDTGFTGSLTLPRDVVTPVRPPLSGP